MDFFQNKIKNVTRYFRDTQPIISWVLTCNVFRFFCSHTERSIWEPVFILKNIYRFKNCDAFWSRLTLFFPLPGLCGLTKCIFAAYGLFDIFLKPTWFIFIPVSESTPPKNRKLAAFAVVFCGSFGTLVLPLAAYILPNWRSLAVSFGIASVVFIPPTVW